MEVVGGVRKSLVVFCSRGWCVEVVGGVCGSRGWCEEVVGGVWKS